MSLKKVHQLVQKNAQIITSGRVPRTRRAQPKDGHEVLLPDIQEKPTVNRATDKHKHQSNNSYKSNGSAQQQEFIIGQIIHSAIFTSPFSPQTSGNRVQL